MANKKRPMLHMTDVDTPKVMVETTTEEVIKDAIKRLQQEILDGAPHDVVVIICEGDNYRLYGTPKISDIKGIGNMMLELHREALIGLMKSKG